MHSIFQDRRSKDDNEYKKNHHERRERFFYHILVNCNFLEKIFYELRYISYIQEQRIPFGSPNIINKIEVDTEDSHSVESLVLYKPLQCFIGGSRVILPNLELPYAGLPTINQSSKLKEMFSEEDLKTTAEISRFIISKERVKSCLKHHASKINSMNIHDFMKQKIETLISSCFYICYQYKLKKLVLSLEKPLMRLLQQQEISIELINESIDYHGEVEIALIDFENLVHVLKKNNSKLLETYLQMPYNVDSSNFS